jgi:hypothetical protein
LGPVLCRQPQDDNLKATFDGANAMIAPRNNRHIQVPEVISNYFLIDICQHAPPDIHSLTGQHYHFKYK